ncbi:MAG: type II toxin-antitoxin system RelE/ParE family toxin [Treponema sp.]|jgi:toxin ParE1/3/4|nr:type II toxin-antitoxin system RelE/ParE family toxin [Treponema sp.]
MFHLTCKAYEDLKGIAIYTQENWGVSQRAIYLKMMDDAFHEIAENPAHGRKIDDIRAGYYKYKIGKHFIFYRLVSKSDIEIVRILHQKMDIESHL